MKDLIWDMASKYDIQSVKERVNNILNEISVKIGLLGAFSAGKTSLLNSILNTHLPVDITPTTKSICLIEPIEGLVENCYFKENGLTREKITYADFAKIVNGDVTGIAGLQILPNKNLPAGCMFVDTPGIDSIGTDEAELTFRYLSLIDAAVVCININDGTLKKSLVDFICCPELRSISNRMVFALTHADQKDVNAIETVKTELIMQLNKLIAEGRFHGTNIEKKVFAINCNADANAEHVFGFLKENILDFLPLLKNERIEWELYNVCEDLKVILSDMHQNMSVDNNALIEKNSHLSSKIQILKDEIAKHQDTIESLNLSLWDKIFQQFMVFREAVASETTTDDRTQYIQKMSHSIRDVIEIEIKKYVKSFVLPASISTMMHSGLNSRMQSIERTKDLSVTIATAVALAAICPAATGAGNIAEGAGGAAASSLARRSAGTMVGQAGTFSKILKSVATVIRDINPLEHLGNAIAQKIKSKSFEDFAREKAGIIAGNVCVLLEAPYYKEIIAPLEERLQEEKKNLEILCEERKKSVDDYISKRKTLERDIKTLDKQLDRKQL